MLFYRYFRSWSRIAFSATWCRTFVLDARHHCKTFPIANFWIRMVQSTHLLSPSTSQVKHSDIPSIAQILKVRSDFQFVLDYPFYKASRKLDNLNLSGNNCLVRSGSCFHWGARWKKRTTRLKISKRLKLTNHERNRMTRGILQHRSFRFTFNLEHRRITWICKHQ